MNEPCIDFKDVKKSYGEQEVLCGVNLRLQPGEFLGLVGVNGAGKTTMIKCLLDMASTSAGSITIFGRPSTETAAREDLAFLPEKFTPPYYLTGRDFIQYMMRLYGTDPAPEKMAEVLEALDFNTRYLDKPVRQLSKGMSQKLGLAACFLSDKPLFILDEPMSGLDPRTRAFLKKYLLAFRERGKTMFFSTHLLTDVETLCDRVAILHGGMIRFAGTTAECCERYNAPDFESAYLACVSGNAHPGD